MFSPARHKRTLLAYTISWLAAAGLLLVLARSASADPIFDAKGFSPNREFASDLAFEHVDPLTGNLLLTFTDLVLPGNAGFDLRIQRTYNIKIYDAYSSTQTYAIGANDPAGLGWTMHFGKVTNIASITPGPTIEMPDGSSHSSFRHMNNSTTDFMTRDLWTLDRDGAPCASSGTDRCPLLRLPNGIRYLFTHGDRQNGPLYATDISDPYGNSIHIQYEAYAIGQPAYVQWVEQRFQTGESRRVTFAYDPPLTGGAPVKRLSSIQSGSRTWRYIYEAAGNRYTLLTSVNPPEGSSWHFTHYGDTWPSPYLLQRVTTPHNGSVTYNYQAQLFCYGSTVVYSPALRTRTIGGTDVPPGTWTYTFSQASPCWSAPVVATIAEPCRTTVYETYAIGAQGDEQPWRIGALKEKRASGGGASQTETLEWTRSMPISPTPESGNSTQTHAPLLFRRTVQRDGVSYSTTHTYHASSYSSSNNRSFNDYGNPERTTESGQLTRLTVRTFFRPSASELSLGNYIAGKVEAETITVDGESFTRAHDYETTGFMKEEDLYGIVTTFTPDAGGNVKTRRDGRGKTISFIWRWGVPEKLQTPAYAISRVVADDSTIQRETRRGFSTLFSYDGLFRLTRLAPPEGDPTTWTYDANGRTLRQQRGGSLTIFALDGFGRLSATNNSQSVQTDTDYDACGRTIYQSFPFTTSNVGHQFQYDGLDRLRVRTNSDNSNVLHAYAAGSGGLTVTITDEESRLTTQTWKAFGTPEDARMVAVLDAGSGTGEARMTTAYSYNALGSLTRVTPPPGHLGRTWTYYTTGLVRTETHPEHGTVDYTYYPNGLVETRTDQEFGRTAFQYDGNNRLTLVNRPSSHPDTEIRYDASDNRTFLSHGGIRSELEPYDGNNRLERRVDTIAGQTFTTRFAYDNRDNLQQITYPSGGKAAYTYDSENRILSITNGGARVYADRFSYHPSGGVASYFSGNGVENRVSYHPSRYWLTGASSGTLLQLGYAHDLVGNVIRTTDVRLGTYDYTYDKVDRLRAATTSSTQAWGNLSFGYDAVGNRLFKTVAGQRTDYAYTANRLTHTTGTEAGTFEHDDNGNMTRDPLGRYTYNADNMMTMATVGTNVTTYGYDGNSMRKLKKAGNVASYYVHGPGNEILSEIERIGTGPLTAKRDYIYAGTRLIAAVRPPTLVVSPEVVVFAGVAGAPSPAPQTVTISEASAGSLSWQATESVPWLMVSPASGTTSPANMSVAVNTAGLAVGTYLGTIQITAPGAAGSPRQVNVRLLVTDQAGFVVQPTSLSFDMTVGQENPASDALYAVVSGGPNAAWTATASHPWITMNPAAGTTPSTIHVSVDGTDKHPGTHRGWIKLEAGTAPGSPRIVPITLVVQPGAGATCAEMAWFCEIFDDRYDGDLGGQGYWVDTEHNAHVVEDPRGLGKVAVLDPPPGETTSDSAPFPGNPPVEGSEITVQVMTEGVAEDSKQVGKIEFFTVAGQAWGKTGRTFAALRFGSTLYLQYGPNIYQVLVDRMESGRWYQVKVAFQNRTIYAYVDGVLLFQTANPLADGLPVQDFAMTGWDFPGAAYVDVINGQSAVGGLVIEPQTLGFRGSASGATAVIPDGQRGIALRSATPPPDSKAKAPGAQAYARLPLSFEANHGQVDGAVQFLARATGYDVFLTPQEVMLSTACAGGGAKTGSVRMTFPGANPDARLVAVEPLSTRSHYYIGNDPSRWRTNVPHYAKVRYENVYPGVDVVFYGNSRRLEYDLVLAPGVDPATVRVAFEGTDLQLEKGDLVLRTAAGDLRQLKALVYQQDGDFRREIEAEYVLKGREVGFRVAAYDRNKPLVLDPVLVYSTYLGGGEQDTRPDEARAIAAGEDGTVYVVGQTQSIYFPTVNPWQGVNGDGEAAFISRFSADGSTLLFSTYLGADDPFHHADEAWAVALDGLGSAYVAGWTASEGFPQLSPLQAAYGGGASDAFLAKLDPSGQLLLSSYLGGPAGDEITGLAVDRQGSVYVSGTTTSPTFPWPPPHKVNEAYGFGVTIDVFVARVLGTARAYLTYLNGPNLDLSERIAVDGEGSVYVVGRTHSLPHADRMRNPFPASPGAYQANLGGDGDVFVSKLDPSGRVVDYSTYLGGSQLEHGYDIAIEPACLADCPAYVAAHTHSPDFPTTAGAWSRTLEGYSDASLTKVAPDGGSLLYSTFLAGDGGRAVAVDDTGAAYVGGFATFENFPEASCLERTVISSRMPFSDAYVVKVDPTGTHLESCALLGGDASDSVNGLTLDGLGGVYAAGTAQSQNFPTTDGAFQRTGNHDAFVFKLEDPITGPPRMQFATAAYRALEGDGEAVITVTRRGALTEPSSVYYRTSPGTATAGVDYEHREGRLTFEVGESALVFTVPVVGDSVAEEDETVNLILSDPMSGDVGFPAQAVLTIGEDDGLTRTLKIAERGNPLGPRFWRALEDMPWLTLSATAGRGPAKVQVTANPTGLSPGTYTGTIIIDAETSDSPQFVLVTFTVVP